jgi:hypothetical protein
LAEDDADADADTDADAVDDMFKGKDGGRAEEGREGKG